MGPRSQYLETVLTCEGDFYSPDFHRQLSVFRERLHQLIFLAEDEQNLILKKVEPWNSVKVTFNIPADAARRLRELAERRDNILRELGVLAVQIDGDCVISLTVSSNNGKTSEIPPKASKQTRTEVRSPSYEDNNMLPTYSGISADTSNVESEPQASSAFNVQTTLGGATLTPFASTSPHNSDKQMQPEFLVTSSDLSLSSTPSSGIWNIQKGAPTVVVAARFPNFSASSVSNTAATAVNVTLPSLSSVDANTMAAAVQLAQSKLLSGVCQNIASSSPLLVNLLQTRRQMNAAGTVVTQPSVSASNEIFGGMLPPAPKRRRSQTKKQKTQASAICPPANVVSWPTPSSESFRFPTAPVQLGIHQLHERQFLTAPVQLGIHQLHHERNEKPKSSPAELNDNEDIKSSSTPRMLINPYTGTMELVEAAERDDVNLSSRISIDNAVRSSNSLVLSLANSLNSQRLHSDNFVRNSALHMPVQNAASMILTLDSAKMSCASTIANSRPTTDGLSVPEICARFGIQAIPAVCGQSSVASFTGAGPCIPSTTSVVSSTMSTASVGSLSDKKSLASHIFGVGLCKADVSGLISTMDSRLANGMSDAQRVNLNVVSSVKNVLPIIHTSSLRLNEPLDNRFAIPISVSNQSSLVSCPNSISAQMSALQFVGPGVISNTRTVCQPSSLPFIKVDKGGTTNHISSAASSAASVVAVSSGAETLNLTVKDELMQLAYTYAKQNGRVQPSDKIKTGLVVNSGSAAQSMPCSSLSIFCASSETSNEAKGVVNTIKSSNAISCSSLPSSTGTSISSESCFFPAVSCFPPEQRRRGESRLVAIGGIVESQTPGTVVPTLACTIPVVRPSTSDNSATHLLSGNWLSANSSLSSESRNQTCTSTTSVVNNTATSVCITSQNTVHTSLYEDKKPLPVPVTSTSMYTLGLHSDALQRLIPKLFPMSVSSSPISGIRNMQAMARAPSFTSLDGKLTTASDRNVSGFSSLPRSCEPNTAVDKTTFESNNVAGVLQCVPAANAESGSKLRVVSAPGKSSQRRCATSKLTEDAVLQRGSSKSHLTVAQLLERAKNSKLTETVGGDESSRVVESCTDLLTAPASVSENKTDSCSPPPVTIPTVDVPSKVVVDQTQIDVNGYPVSSVAVSIPGLPSPIPTAPQQSVPPPPSLACIMPVTAFALPRQLSINSPRYPLNLTESVKNVMRGVGYYPSPPASPTASIGRVLTGSKQMNVLSDGPSADSTVMMMTTTELCPELNRTDEQSVISNILDELSKNDSLAKCKIIQNNDCSAEEIQYKCEDILGISVKSTDMTLLDSSERDHSGTSLCSLPDLIVSTTGGNGCKTTSEECSSPTDDTFMEASVAEEREVFKQHVSENSLAESVTYSTVSLSSSMIQVPSVDEIPLLSTDKTIAKVDECVNNFVLHSDPSVDSLDDTAQASSESASTAECADIEIVQELQKLPVKAVGLNEQMMKDSFEDNISSCETVAGISMQALEENSSGTSICTLESLDGGCILVNGRISECTVSEQVYAAECYAPDAVVAPDDANSSEDAMSTATLEELANPSALAARPVTRRTRTLPNCTSFVSSNTSPSPMLSATALPVITRMTTRSSNRSTSVVACDSASSDSTSTSVKLTSRRTPIKSVESQSCPTTEALTPLMPETESIAAANRRSVRAPRIIICSSDNKKSEPLLVAGADSSNTGVSLRSRVKGTQLSSTAKTAVNTLAKKTICKGAASKQLDVSENCTPDLVTRTNENSVKCDLNGSEEVS